MERPHSGDEYTTLRAQESNRGPCMCRSACMENRDHGEMVAINLSATNSCRVYEQGTATNSLGQPWDYRQWLSTQEYILFPSYVRLISIQQQGEDWHRPSQRCLLSAARTKVLSSQGPAASCIIASGCVEANDISPNAFPMFLNVDGEKEKLPPTLPYCTRSFRARRHER